MKIGIIVTGLVEPTLKADYGEYASMIIDGLSPHGDFRYEVYSALERKLPTDISKCDGYILTGSVHDSYADELWINELAVWIRECDKQRKSLAGICFGHQIIARALGGKVEKSSKGWGLGMSHNQMLTTASWMEPKVDNINILVCHQDQVTAIPDSLQLVSSSDFCPNYMLSKDAHILTIQGHPEFSIAFEHDLIEKKKQIFGQSVCDRAHESLDKEPDSAIMMKWFANFFEGNLRK